MTWELRRAGIPAELYLGTAKGPGKQLKYADFWGVPIAAPLRLQREGARHRDAQGHGRRPRSAPRRSPTARSGWRSGPASARSPRCELVATVREMLAAIEESGSDRDGRFSGDHRADHPRRRLADHRRARADRARPAACRVELDPRRLSRVAAQPASRSSASPRDYREDFERFHGGAAVRPVLEYGVTTGFGEFKNIPIAPDRLEELQRNLLLQPRGRRRRQRRSRRPGELLPGRRWCGRRSPSA